MELRSDIRAISRESIRSIIDRAFMSSTAPSNVEGTVERHYTVENLGRVILDAVRADGKDPERLTVADLAPIDEFHIRGRGATEELAQLTGLSDVTTVLDIGSGLGGTARYLAAEHRCHVTGIDLTQSFCDVARELSVRLDLAERTAFRRASALDLPFDDHTFDVVWTEHAQMNIEDKQRFYSEAARVLRPAGKLAFHDIFRADGAEPLFPVPWASAPEYSFLAKAGEVRGVLSDVGLNTLHWEDSSDRSRAWFEVMIERIAERGPPPVGVHLLMGSTAKQKVTNMLRNLTEGRIVTIQAVLHKPDGALAETD